MHAEQYMYINVCFGVYLFVFSNEGGGGICCTEVIHYTTDMVKNDNLYHILRILYEKSCNFF